MTKKKKFDDLFKQTANEVDVNGDIDFVKSDIHNIPPKKSTLKETKEKRTNKVQGYFTATEFEEWRLTFEILEKPSDRIRRLVLDDIKRRREKD